MEIYKNYPLYSIDIVYNKIYIKNKKEAFINKTGKSRYIHLNLYVKDNVEIEISGKCKVWIDYTERKVLEKGVKYKLPSTFSESLVIEIAPKQKVEYNDIFRIEKAKDQLKSIRELLVSYEKERNLYFKLLLEHNESYNDSFISKFFNSDKESIIYIGDKLTHVSLQEAYNVMDLNRNKVFELLGFLRRNSKKVNMPKYLFIESFWEGNQHSWHKSFDAENEVYIRILKEELKKYGIKTIFYNKEDPYHFDEFLWIGKYADLIITVSKENVQKYEKVYSDKKIIYSPFVVNENVFYFQENNRNLKINEKLYFAGNYYNNRFGDRKKFLNTIFEYMVENEIDFEIIDRNLKNKNTTLGFPEDYKEYIKTGTLDVEELNKYIESFDIGINVNSIVDTTSVVSRRLLEHIALGKIMITNYSKAVEDLNISTIVYSKDNNIEEVFLKLKELINKKDLYFIRKENSQKVLQNYGSMKFKEELKNILENTKVLK